MISARALISRSLVFVLCIASVLLPAPMLELHAQAPPTAAAIPDYVAYHQLFRHILALKKIADQAAAAGQDRSSLRSLLRKEAGLDEYEGQLLESKAATCENQLDAQAAQAKAIIDAIHSRYPYGILNPSYPPPAPDPRLQEIQQERNGIVLLCRDQLHNALGDDAFTKLDTWLKTSMSRNSSKPRVKRQTAR